MLNSIAEIRERAEHAEKPEPVTSYWFAYRDRQELVRLYDEKEREVAALRAALKHLRDNALMGVDREYARTALNQSGGAS